MGISAATRARWMRRLLGLITALFIGALYIPFLMMFVLSFTGPTGGPTFPLHGLSTYWYEQLLTGAASGGIATEARSPPMSVRSTPPSAYRCCGRLRSR